jgi:hypothetical protein
MLESIAHGDTNRGWLRAAERRPHRFGGGRPGGAVVPAAPRDRAGIIRSNGEDRMFANFNSENHGVGGIVSPVQSTCT